MGQVALLGSALAAAVLLVTAPPPAALATRLAADATADPLAPVVAGLTLLAWLLAAWLALTALLTGGSRLPGAVGGICSAVLPRVAPGAVRRAMALALGIGMAVSTGSTTAAAASPAPRTASAQGVSLDWPGATPDQRPPDLQIAPAGRPAPAASAGELPKLDWPSSAATAPPVVVHLDTQAPPVVVQPGDTLWDLAAQALPAPADDAAIAAAWPSWWSANRQVIGEDPDLLRPGQQLRPPALEAHAPALQAQPPASPAPPPALPVRPPA